MLESVPPRPLTQREVDALSESDAIDLAFPATPASIREGETGEPRMYDLLLFIEEAVVAIAYQEADSGWTVVTRATDETEDAYEVAYNKLLEYRGYEELDREDALRQAVSKLYGLPENVMDANPEELDSLGEP